MKFLRLWLVLVLLAAYPFPATMQTDAGTTDIATLIEYSTALYVLIGIAAGYSVLTLICCLLVICACHRKKQHSRRQEQSKSPYNRNLHKLSTRMFPRLATIAEESESRCSSTTSLTRHGVEETSLVIAHKAALDADEGIAKIPAVVDDEFDGSHDRSLSFTNKTAVELESREEGSVPVHGYDDDINEVPEEAQLPITANEVKVPFFEENSKKELEIKSEATKEYRNTDSPIHPQTKPIHPVTDSPRRSPFHSRKHPQIEIPSYTENKADLTDYQKRKKSIDGSSGSVGVHGPPKLSPQHLLGDGKKIDSPIRSRPKPRNPVTASPSQSLLTRFNKKPIPNIAVQSLSASKGASSEVTSEKLLGELKQLSMKWYIIGEKLNFPRRRLNTILSENKDKDKCLALLCEEWIRGKEEPCWQDIVEALKSDLVNEEEIAISLEEKYGDGKNNSKTWL